MYIEVNIEEAAALNVGSPREQSSGWPTEFRGLWMSSEFSRMLGLASWLSDTFCRIVENNTKLFIDLSTVDTSLL